MLHGKLFSSIKEHWCEINILYNFESVFAKIYTAMSSIEMSVVGCCLKFSSYMYVIQSAILFSLYRVSSLLRFKLIENTISKHAEFWKQQVHIVHSSLKIDNSSIQISTLEFLLKEYTSIQSTKFLLSFYELIKFWYKVNWKSSCRCMLQRILWTLENFIEPNVEFSHTWGSVNKGGSKSVIYHQ